MISQDINHHRARKKHKVSDLTVEDASFKLTERQFIAWKFAVLEGLSNIEISEAMSDAETVIFPSDVQETLNNAARRGFTVPGEEMVLPKRRVKVAA